MRNRARERQKERTEKKERGYRCRIKEREKQIERDTSKLQC